MKELSIEQKSKCYDEAIHRAKLALDCCDSASQITKNVVYDIFPELKENEGEGIRKEIISALKCANHKGVYDKHIAWLERQCEQKQAHKYEPMFKVGDWVVTDKNGVVQIKAIKNDNYVLENASKFSVYYVDKCWKKWGISDAKDGDVLYSLDSNQPFIYKERNAHEQATAYCGINKYGKFFVWNAKDCIITLDKYIPATKEQRDALMKAMADAGYEWDVKKKELKKIKQKQAIDCIDSHPKDNWELVHEFVETFGRMPEDEDELNVLVEYVLKRQKPTEWNEEDDYNLQCMIAKAVKDIQNGNVGRNQELINWLKSIKDRVQHQKQWKPSEEQLEFLKKCIESYNEVSFPTEFRVFRSLYNDLKKLAE